MFKYPEKYRIRNKGPLSSETGEAGCFAIPLEQDVTAFCIASNGFDWEHVSVHVKENNKPETPEWQEMCLIKSLFWDEEDCVIQYHPPRSKYINNFEHCLHLWRPTEIQIPLPPSFLVGVKA